jgi:quercetin dioxygenase-like cupin family protein
LYVLNGELALHHGEQTSVLTEGDAVYFDASAAHSYRCSGKRPAGAIIVTMHQAQQIQPSPLRGVSTSVARVDSQAPRPKTAAAL